MLVVVVVVVGTAELSAQEAGAEAPAAAATSDLSKAALTEVPAAREQSHFGRNTSAATGPEFIAYDIQDWLKGTGQDNLYQTGFTVGKRPH